LTNAKDIAISTLDARVPAAKGRNSISKRTSLSEEVQSRLWQVIDPHSAKNPWTGNRLLM
jgi:hypothetical protein